MTNTVVITGANRGIGLALVREYLQRGDHVFALCRQPSAELLNSGATVVDSIDVTNPETLAGLGDRIGQPDIDILINNAGILESTSLENMDFESMQRQFQVNSLGPLRVTFALLPYLSRTARVGMITSRMGSIADNGSGSSYGYRMSKAALNAASMSLARDLRPRGIAVAILHPGFVQTEMVGGVGDVSADTAASRLARRLDELSLDNSGTFWHANGEVLPW